MSGLRVLYWFRTDLRLHDSPALHAALDLQPECLYPVWCWDPHYVRHARVGPNRWNFLLDCQNDLSESLAKLNPKQKLLVLRESAITLLPKLFKEWNITHLVFEKDTDSYAASRDAEVIKQARKLGITVVVKVGRTLWDPELITRKNGEKPTMTYASLVQAAKKIGAPRAPLPSPINLPDPGDLSLTFENDQLENGTDLNQSHRTGMDKSFATLGGPKHDFSIPTLEEMGIPPSSVTTPHIGGESQALKNLEGLLEDQDFIATFSKPETAPTSFRPASTTLLSPHLHFGSLGIGYFLHKVEVLLSAYKGKKKLSTEPTNIPGQLYFREMYFAAQYAIGQTFNQVEGNPQVRYIPWHLHTPSPRTLTSPAYTIDSKLAHRYFLRWAWGLTGFPFIDALMRQLRSEGWIHHLGRHMVACFLTRGGCYVSWERGAEVFEQLLLDHEVSCNVGNWMWLSCTAFYSQYYRCYSPVAFGKKWDKTGAFIRRYVPELAAFPDKWIYEPHNAPVDMQQKARCLIRELGEGIIPDPEVAYASVPSPPADLFPLKEDGGDFLYPIPMFDFGHRKEICMTKMKQAYAIGLHGDDKRVVEGRTEELDKLFGGLKIPEQEELEASENLTGAQKSKAGTKRKTGVEAHNKSLDDWVQKKSKLG